MEILLKMIPVTERVPADQQDVLADNGTAIVPCTYESRTGTFGRYKNYIEGDRALSYFYSGVISWCPFPESSGRPGFKAEQEPPPEWKDVPVLPEAALTTTPIDPTMITSINAKTGKVTQEKKPYDPGSDPAMMAALFHCPIL